MPGRWHAPDSAADPDAAAQPVRAEAGVAAASRGAVKADADSKMAGTDTRESGAVVDRATASRAAAVKPGPDRSDSHADPHPDPDTHTAVPRRLRTFVLDRFVFAVERVISADAEDKTLQPQSFRIVEHTIRQRYGNSVLELDLVIVHLARVVKRNDELDRIPVAIDDRAAALGDV
jgi:hypothetical protein